MIMITRTRKQEESFNFVVHIYDVNIGNIKLSCTYNINQIPKPLLSPNEL